MIYKNLEIIGTSHISKESVNEIKKVISENDKAIVTVELDKQRLDYLLKNNPQTPNYRTIKKIGVKGFIFAWLASWMSKKLGKSVGMNPGIDMKIAVMEASKKKMEIVLIDQNIEITLKKISKAIGWKERWQFIKDFFNGIFFRKKQMKEYGLENFDLTKVPSTEIIEKMMNSVRLKYPGIYKVLILERNEIMAKRLIILMKKNPDKKIISVVGAGHKKGMIDIIKKKWDCFEIVN